MIYGPEAHFDQHGSTEHFEPGVRTDNSTGQGTARILSGTDYADMSTVSRKQWLVHHLLAVGELSAFYGEPGSGKSVLAQDIGLHLAAGLPWFGREVKQSAVLYVALERAAVVARRALAFGIEHDMVAGRLPFRMVRGPLDFRDHNVAAEIVASLTDLARRYRCDAGLVIIDTVEPRAVRRRREQPERYGCAYCQPGPHPGRPRHSPVADTPPASRKRTNARSRCLARRGRHHRAHHQDNRRPAGRGGQEFRS